MCLTDRFPMATTKRPKWLNNNADCFHEQHLYSIVSYCDGQRLRHDPKSLNCSSLN